MSRVAVRAILGSLVGAVVALVISPLVWTAGAQPRIEGGRLPSVASSSLFLPTVPTLPAASPTSGVPATVTPATTTRPATSFRPRVTVPPVATTSTTSTTVPPTTVATLPVVAPPPVTLPLAIGRQSGHVSPVFPILGGIGIVALIALLTTQWFLTAPGRRGGPTL